MKYKWYRKRGYRHFDSPVGESFADRVCNPSFVTEHAWSPLIHYIKRVKRYKPKIDKLAKGKTEFKDRPIMFASHRDACILAKYASDIGDKLDAFYKLNGLHKNVIAYRSLGRTNYHFSADAYRFAKQRGDCVVLCFDITGFFDNLDHKILKDRLNRILEVRELPEDWHSVYRHVTKYRCVKMADIEAYDDFKARLEKKISEPIATIAELKVANIPINNNKEKYGIPQGTPISAAFSNLYMIDVDLIMVDACNSIGALYQRYSDDILIVCPSQFEDQLTLLLKLAVFSHKLQIKDEKTERAEFKSGSSDVFQYLGFNVSQEGAIIRPSSLARLHRKAKRAVKMTKIRGKFALASGKVKQISTKRLRQRFWPTGARNFSKYARRAAKEFGSKAIVRQAMRLERMVDEAIKEISDLR